MDNKIIKDVVSYLMLTSVFVTGGLIRWGVTIEWYHFLYLPFAFGCLIRYHQFSLRLALLLAALAVASLATYVSDVALVVKQLINISFSVVVFYNFLIFEEWNYEAIFKKYLTLAKAVLVIGFIQVLIFSFDEKDGLAGNLYLSVFPFLRDTNISSRFQSVTQEPALIAFVFAPVVFLSLNTLIRRSGRFMSRGWSVLFIVGYALTLSLVAYAGIMLMLMILYFRNFTLRKLSLSVFFFSLLAVLAVLIYASVPEVRLRTDDTFFGVDKDITDSAVYRHVNLTTYAQLSNAYVTGKSLREHPLTGTGLGTYQVTYDRLLPVDLRAYWSLNREDASSLAFRLLSETGLIGFLSFLFFLLRYRIRSRPAFTDDQDFLWMLNAGIFVTFVLFLIRSGHYTNEARILFLMLYYGTYKAVKKNE